MKFSAFGFTLVELLVVISVMAIIGVMAFANYNTLGQDQNLKAAASDVQSLLRLAQANASARLKCGSDTTGSGADWTVSFESDKVTMNLKCQIVPPTIPVPPPLVLTNSIIIDSINGCNNNFPVTVTYQPLLGGLVFADTGAVSCVGTPTLTVTLKDGGGNTKTVIINKGGSIGIQ